MEQVEENHSKNDGIDHKSVSLNRMGIVFLVEKVLCRKVSGCNLVANRADKMLCRGFLQSIFILSGKASSHSPVMDNYFQVEFYRLLPNNAFATGKFSYFH